MNFFLKSLIKRQLKGMPDDQIDMFITIIEKNPEFFKKMADEIQAKISSGMSQQDAAQFVLKNHEQELRQIMGKV